MSDCPRSFNKLTCPPLNVHGFHCQTLVWDPGYSFLSLYLKTATTLALPNSQLSLFFLFAYSSDYQRRSRYSWKVVYSKEMKPSEWKMVLLDPTQVTEVTKCGPWTWLALKYLNLCCNPMPMHSYQQLPPDLPAWTLRFCFHCLSPKAFKKDVFLPCFKKKENNKPSLLYACHISHFTSDSASFLGPMPASLCWPRIELKYVVSYEW